MSCRDDALSKPDVGSSKINSEGSMTISNPTFTLFLWPPKISRFSTVPTNDDCRVSSPRNSITLSTTRTLSGFDKSVDSLCNQKSIIKRYSSYDRKIDRKSSCRTKIRDDYKGKKKIVAF